MPQRSSSWIYPYSFNSAEAWQQTAAAAVPEASNSSASQASPKYSQKGRHRHLFQVPRQLSGLGFADMHHYGSSCCLAGLLGYHCLIVDATRGQFKSCDWLEAPVTDPLWMRPSCRAWFQRRTTTQPNRRANQDTDTCRGQYKEYGALDNAGVLQVIRSLGITVVVLQTHRSSINLRPFAQPVPSGTVVRRCSASLKAQAAAGTHRNGR